MANSRIVELSTSIAKNTAIVDEFCKKTGIPTPSFDVNAPPTVNIPPNEAAVTEAKDNIIAATRELGQLMQGPAEIVTDIGFIDAFVFQTISRYQIAEHIPVGKDLSFDALSSACGLQADHLRRILRFAMTNGFFTETSPDHVGHTSASRLLAENPMYRCAFAMTYDEGFPASARAADALQLHPGTQDPKLSGWGLANNAKAYFWQELKDHHPDRHRTVATAMDAWDSWIPAAPLAANYPWSSAKKVVDIGGGHGLVSTFLARHSPTTSFMVQDLPSVVAGGPDAVPEELRDRVTFMAHDMFDPQPVKDADVYFFRSVFHDWPDKSCVQILKALVPAMRPGVKVVINDACMPPAGTLPPRANRAKRNWDLYMMLLFNARDREAGDWEGLFAQADKRFKFLGVRMPTKEVDQVPPPMLLNIIEAVWEP